MMLRRLLLLSPLLGAVSDTRPEKSFRIYFFGNAGEPAHRAYKTLVKTLERFSPELFKKLNITYTDLTDRPVEMDARLRQLVQTKPDMVLALNGVFAVAARRFFPGTPVVFSCFENPVQRGIVSSMKARQEPACGISLADDLEGKRFEILKQAFPHIRNVAILADGNWLETMGGEARSVRESKQQRLETFILRADKKTELAALFARPAAARYDAWYIPATSLEETSAPLIIEQLRNWRKPNIWAARDNVDHGAQMAYSQETGFVWHSLAELIFRIYSGEPPGAIPILRPTHFTLTIRMKPGDNMPDPAISIVRRSDQVLQ